MVKIGLFLGAQNGRFWPKKVGSRTLKPHISPCSGCRMLKFEQHLGKMQYHFHVKFDETDVAKCVKFDHKCVKNTQKLYFSTLKVCNPKTIQGTQVPFLPKKVYVINYFHNKFGGNRSMLKRFFVQKAISELS